MKVYLEITLLPSSEIDVSFLWSKVFQQIHLGLVEMQDEQGRLPIGVSFPEYVMGKRCSLLGRKLRLFAHDETTLVKFDIAKWLDRLSNYVHYTSIQKVVPEKIKGYATYQREQRKNNKERLARRYAMRHNIDYETALACYEGAVLKKSTVPFIRLKSLSSGKNFSLGIKKILVTGAIGYFYNTYGLSALSSVPEF